jgi:hypothetical protein
LDQEKKSPDLLREKVQRSKQEREDGKKEREDSKDVEQDESKRHGRVFGEKVVYEATEDDMSKLDEKISFKDNQIKNKEEILLNEPKVKEMEKQHVDVKNTKELKGILEDKMYEASNKLDFRETNLQQNEKFRSDFVKTTKEYLKQKKLSKAAKMPIAFAEAVNSDMRVKFGVKKDKKELEKLRAVKDKAEEVEKLKNESARLKNIKNNTKVLGSEETEVKKPDEQNEK